MAGGLHPLAIFEGVSSTQAFSTRTSTMALKIALKPHEKLILGGAVVTNGNAKAELIIENAVPILREKDILSADNTNTPCKRIYFIVQLMYVDEKNIATHQESYRSLVRELLDAAPSTLGLVDQISTQITGGGYYQALKIAKKLIAYEEELISYARSANGSLSNRTEE